MLKIRSASHDKAQQKSLHKKQFHDREQVEKWEEIFICVHTDEEKNYTLKRQNCEWERM